MHIGAIVAKLFPLTLFFQNSYNTKQDPHWYFTLTKQGPQSYIFFFFTNKLARYVHKLLY